METTPAAAAAAAPTPEWEIAHRDLVGLAARGAAHEHALGRALLRAFRAAVWLPMGFGSFVEYAERVVGLTPRQLAERMRVARALEELPRTSAALAGGRVHFSAVRELSRVATPDTEEDWLAAAEHRSVGEIERLVSRHAPGDRPDDPPDDSARRHRISLEVSADVLALYRDALARLRRESDARLTDEEGLALMARAVLGGPADPGRSSYQIQMTVCERCGAATQDGGGRELPVEPAVAEAAACDAQLLDARGRATQAIPPATRRLVLRRHHGRCAAPGCRNAVFVDVHHTEPRADGGDHDPERLIVLCGSHHAAVHRGALVIEGTASTGFTFRHADGSPYGAPADPRAAAVLADLQKALVGMGFKHREARWMVDTVSPHAGVCGDAGFVDLFRRAMAAWNARGHAAS